MDLKYWWFLFLRAPIKQKLKMLGCFFGQHDGVYGIFGYNGYRVKCYKCDKVLDEGIEFEDKRVAKAVCEHSETSDVFLGYNQYQEVCRGCFSVVNQGYIFKDVRTPEWKEKCKTCDNLCDDHLICCMCKDANLFREKRR